jgi:hypothetical protein
MERTLWLIVSSLGTLLPHLNSRWERTRLLIGANIFENHRSPPHGVLALCLMSIWFD